MVTTCYYDTVGYKNATLGGFSISDEMCVNYIHYYPATKLEVCKSSVSEKTLADYFAYMKRYVNIEIVVNPYEFMIPNSHFGIPTLARKEHQHKIRIGGARSENYRSIRWTKPRIDELYTMYIQEPLSMQCNRSDGMRFEGYDWEGAPITPVRIQLPIHRESCQNYNPFWMKPLEDGECDLLGECIY